MLPQKPQPVNPTIIGTWTERETDRQRAVVDAHDREHIYLVDLTGGECTCGGRGDCPHWQAVQDLVESDRLQYRDRVTCAGWKRCYQCGKVTLAVLSTNLTTAHVCEVCGAGRAVYTQPARAGGNGRPGRRARTVQYQRSWEVA